MCAEKKITQIKTKNAPKFIENPWNDKRINPIVAIATAIQALPVTFRCKIDAAINGVNTT